MTTYHIPNVGLDIFDSPADGDTVDQQTAATPPAYAAMRADAEDDRYRHVRARYGGLNWGAAIFGWLVTLAVAVLLLSMAAAVVTSRGRAWEVFAGHPFGGHPEGQGTSIGTVAAAVLSLVIMTAYYAGGYVAGRMSRFDGGRQGLGVWAVGLLVPAAVGLGIMFGSLYDVAHRVDLRAAMTMAGGLGLRGLVTAVAVLVAALVAALVGGRVGCRYHRKIDRDLS